MISFDNSYVPLSQEDIRTILINMAGNMKITDVTSETLEVYVRLYRLCENREDTIKPEEFIVNWIDNPNFDPEAYHKYLLKDRYYGFQDAYEYADHDLDKVMKYRKDKFHKRILGFA